MNVAQGVVACLQKYGVKNIFGIPGDSINFLMDALRTNDNVDFKPVSHEEAGAFAASAQSKHGQTLSACMGTSGPGAIHLLNGLYDAQKDGAAVVAITGQVDTKKIGLKSHQEVNTEMLFENVTCFNQTIWNPENAMRIVDCACRAAMVNKGVAHISIPLDIADQEIIDDEYLQMSPVKLSRLSATQTEYEKAAELIRKAEKPLILAGVGCLEVQEDFKNFISEIKAPVIKTLKAKALLADEDEYCLGGLGLLGVRPAVSAMADCDLLILMGTDYPYSEFLNKEVKTIQIDNNPISLARRKSVDLAIHSDIACFLKAMKDFEFNNNSNFLEEKQSYMKLYLSLMDQVDLHHTDCIKPQNLMRHLGEAANEDCIFSCDTGSVTSYFAKSLRIKDKQRVYFSGNLASMGFGVSAAVGLQLAEPNKQVIAVVGDGSANMLLGEFGTLARHQLPVKVFIMNNHRLHLIDFEENVSGLPQYGTELYNPDYAMIAKAYGFKGLTVDDPKQLTEAIKQALGSKGPCVVDVRVNPKQMLYPPEVNFDQAYGFSLAKVKELWNEVIEEFKND